MGKKKSGRLEYRRYLESSEWRKVKTSMVGPRVCAACHADEELHLHHMYYPKNLWETRPWHCCWLCRNCHDAFHSRHRHVARGKHDFMWLRKKTIKLIRAIPMSPGCDYREKKMLEELTERIARDE